MEEQELQGWSRLFARIARKYLFLAPVWMDVDDLVQDAWVAHCQGRHAKHGRLARHGILDGLSRNKLLTRNWRPPRTMQRVGWEVALPDEVGEERDWSDGHETFAAWARALQPEEYAAVVGLVLGFRNKDTATWRGVTESAVSHALRRAKQKLQELQES